MKKHLSLKNFSGILLFLFLSTSLSAQNTFYKKYDYAGDDFGNCVIATSDGGYAIVGSTNSFGAGNYDVWLLKTDGSGDTLWTKTYGGPDNDEGYCLRETSDGGFIVAGYKTVSQHYADGWVFKTDASGTMEWEHTFGTDLNGESAAGVVNAGEDTFLVAGTLNSTSYLMEIDAGGNLLWEHSYFLTNSSSVSSICKVNDTIYAVVGSIQMHAGGEWYPNLFTIDSDGTLWYQLTYMLRGSGGFNFIVNTDDEGMVFGGAESGENIVYKNSLKGDYLWSYSYPQEVWYQGTTSAVQTTDKNIVITDNTYYASLRKLNAMSGDTLWTRSLDLYNDGPKYTCLAATPDHGIIITGYSDNHGVILVKTMENGSMTGVDAPAVAGNAGTVSQIAPNPFAGKTEIGFQLTKPATVELYITDGRVQKIKTLVSKHLDAGSYRFVWDGTGNGGAECPAGVYYAVLKTGPGIMHTRKIIKTVK